MTQAVNLANFANNLDTSGGVNPSALNAAVAVAKGGTGSTTSSAARTALGLAIGTDIPSTTGTGASGTWGVNITGSAASSSNLTTTNWTVIESGGQLLFKYGGVTKFTMDSTNGFTAA